MGEAKRRKKLDANYGRVRNLTKAQRRELEKQKREFLQKGDFKSAGKIMAELGDQILDENFQPIEGSKEEFVDNFASQIAKSIKANSTPEMIKRREEALKKYGRK